MNPALASTADRLLGLVPGLAAGLLLVACASPVSVRELATGQIDTPAYELRGEDLQSLQDQARRLCPQGGQLLHMAYRGDGLRAPGDSWWGQRWSEAQRLAAPVQAQAQLTVLCQADASRSQLGGPSWPLEAKPVAAQPLAPTGVPHDVDMLAPESVMTPPATAVAAASAAEPPAAQHAAAETAAASAAPVSAKPVQTAAKAAAMTASAPRPAQARRQTPYPVLSY